MAILKRKWVIPFMLLMGLSVLGAVYPVSNAFDDTSGLDSGAYKVKFSNYELTPKGRIWYVKHSCMSVVNPPFSLMALRI